MANKRPPTVKEIQASKRGNSGELDHEVRVINISTQEIRIHLRPPGKLDFFRGAQDVPLMPGAEFTFKKKRLWAEQITNLCKRRKIRKIYDSEEIADKVKPK